MIGTLGAMGKEFAIDERTKRVVVHGHYRITPLAIRKALAKMTEGKVRPRLIALTRIAMDRLNEGMLPVQRFTDQALFSAGFWNLMVGGVPIVPIEEDPAVNVDDIQDLLDALAAGSPDNFAYELDKQCQRVVAKIVFVE